MKTKLTKAAENYLKGCSAGIMLTKWTNVNAIRYMKTFFSDPTITTKSITKGGFIADGFESCLPIVQVFMYDMFDVKFIEFMRIAVQNDPSLVSSSCAAAMNQFTKSQNAVVRSNGTEVKMSTLLESVSFNGYARGNDSASNVINIILGWEDTFKDQCKRIVDACDYILANNVNEDLCKSDISYAKFPTVVDFFGLDKAGEELLKFCYTFRTTGLKLPRDVQNFEDRMRQLSQFTGVDVKDISKYASFKQKQSNKKKQFYPFIIETVSLQNSIWNYLANERADSLEECFFKVLDTNDALPREFFDTIDKENSDTIVKIINGNINNDRPRHILLYGKPGTGKTSYMSLICKLTGRKGFVITQATPDNQGNNTSEYNTGVESRFMSITIADDRIDSTKSIIIVDEADEMINCAMPFGFFGGGGGYDTHIKSLLNQIMDTTKTPIVWITNNCACMIDPSCRRRFDYSVYFDNFNETQRKLIWKNNVKRFNLKALINEKMIDELAGAYNVTPGGIAMACQDVVDIKPNKAEVMDVLKKVLDKHCELLGINTKQNQNKKFKPVDNYSLEGLNIESSIPINEVEKICKTYLDKKAKGEAKRGLCFLLSGPSGTGKTEFTKYLGSTLGRCVNVVRGSSVLDKYVGETEQKIAEAFKNAEDNDAILFMDEVDGLLNGREKAHQSWEISQVNEILQQMENFRGIFIAATNFSDNLDSASVRRFTFKFKFDELKEDGIISFYNRYFGNLTKKDKFYNKLKDLRMVTPGDFATVKTLSEYTQDKINSEWVYNALSREIDAKKDNNGIKNAKPRSIGY